VIGTYNYFNNTLMFVSKPENYSPIGHHSKGGPLLFNANVRLGLKCCPLTNTPAFTLELIREKNGSIMKMRYSCFRSNLKNIKTMTRLYTKNVDLLNQFTGAVDMLEMDWGGEVARLRNIEVVH